MKRGKEMANLFGAAGVLEGSQVVVLERDWNLKISYLISQTIHGEISYHTVKSTIQRILKRLAIRTLQIPWKDLFANTPYWPREALADFHILSGCDHLE